MSEHIFSAVLTFSVLAAGTMAVGADFVAPRQAAARSAAVANLPPVTVIGKRIAAESVTLPKVTVIGSRLSDTELAIDDTAARQRVQ